MLCGKCLAEIKDCSYGITASELHERVVSDLEKHIEHMGWTFSIRDQAEKHGLEQALVGLTMHIHSK